MESLREELTTGSSSSSSIIAVVKPVCNGIPIVVAWVEDPLWAWG